MEDGRCKLGLQGRLELVMLIESGSSLRAAAGEMVETVRGSGYRLRADWRAHLS